jgi:hypothetical protein
LSPPIVQLLRHFQSGHNQNYWRSNPSLHHSCDRINNDSPFSLKNFSNTISLKK